MDRDGNKFGGYISAELKKNDDFFGTGESFLFKLKDNSAVIYGCTMNNCYFNTCDDTGIGFGSDPHFGLFINENLDKGSTHACQTFSNDVLTSKNHFGIRKLEVNSF